MKSFTPSPPLHNIIFFVLFSAVVQLPVPFLAHIKISIGQSSIGVFHLIFLLGCAAAAACAYRSGRLSNVRSLGVWLPVALALVITAVFSLNRSLSAEAAVRFAAQGLFWAALFQQAVTLEEGRELLAAMVAIVGIAAVIGILERIIGDDFIYRKLYVLSYREAIVTFAGRNSEGVMGTLGHPLPFAVMLAAFVPASLLKFSERWRRLPLFLLLIAGVLVCESRAGVLSMAVGLSVYTLVMNPAIGGRRSRVRLLAGLGLIAAIAAGALIFLVGGRFQSGFALDSHRLGCLHAGIQIIGDFPWFGIGLGVYPEVIDRYWFPGIDRLVPTPDNQHLRWAIETGAVGIVLASAFLTLYGRRVADVLRRSEGLDFRAACLGGAVGTFAALFFMDGFFWVPIQMSFWSLLGLALSEARA